VVEVVPLVTAVVEEPPAGCHAAAWLQERDAAAGLRERDVVARLPDQDAVACLRQRDVAACLPDRDEEVELQVEDAVGYSQE
jgi:hypothetical protein